MHSHHISMKIPTVTVRGLGLPFTYEIHFRMIHAVPHQKNQTHAIVFWYMQLMFCAQATRYTHRNKD